MTSSNLVYRCPFCRNEFMIARAGSALLYAQIGRHLSACPDRPAQGKKSDVWVIASRMADELLGLRPKE